MWGWRFGKRGAILPWPYIGWRRGGLPRCWYFWGARPSKEEELTLLREQANALKRELELIEDRIKKIEEGA